MKRLFAGLLLTAVFLVQSQTPLFFIEGNIGAGKSTLIEMLQKHLPDSVVLMLEPCNEWQNVQGFNLLHAFYENPKNWACLFQIYASMTRIRKQEHDSKFDQSCQIMERSWFSDRYCFASMLHSVGLIDQMQWLVYEQMWDFYMRNAQLPAGFIYLRVEPDLCLKRLQTRARSEEVGISLEYLTNLHVCHEQLLIEKMSNDQISKIPVLVLDGTLNFKDDFAVQQDFVRQILDFLQIRGNIDLKDMKEIQ